MCVSVDQHPRGPFRADLPDERSRTKPVLPSYVWGREHGIACKRCAHLAPPGRSRLPDRNHLCSQRWLNALQSEERPCGGASSSVRSPRPRRSGYCRPAQTSPRAGRPWSGRKSPSRGQAQPLARHNQGGGVPDRLGRAPRRPPAGSDGQNCRHPHGDRRRHHPPGELPGLTRRPERTPLGQGPEGRVPPEGVPEPKIEGRRRVDRQSPQAVADGRARPGPAARDHPTGGAGLRRRRRRGTGGGRSGERAGKPRYVGLTRQKGPLVHPRMLEGAMEHEVQFDAARMPLNVLDAHFRGFEKHVVPVLLRDAAHSWPSPTMHCVGRGVVPHRHSWGGTVGEAGGGTRTGDSADARGSAGGASEAARTSLIPPARRLHARAGRNPWAGSDLIPRRASGGLESR